MFCQIKNEKERNDLCIQRSVFPNLGIYLKNVGKSIDLFGIEIAYYGIIIGTAILLGFWIAAREAKRTGQNSEIILIWGLSASLRELSGQDFIM